MRAKLFALLAIVMLFAVAFAAFGPSRTAQAQDATPTVCADETYKNAIGADFKTARDTMAALDMSKPEDVIKQTLLIIGTRQKYEDMTVSPDCVQTNLILIAYLANSSDGLTVRLAQLADPKNETLAAVVKGQTERTQKFLDLLVKSITPDAAATPAATEAQ